MSTVQYVLDAQGGGLTSNMCCCFVFFLCKFCSESLSVRTGLNGSMCASLSRLTEQMRFTGSLFHGENVFTKALSD